MGAKTKIPWTGSTWNIMRGCRRRDPGCLHCYAEGQAIRSSGPGGAHFGLVRSTDHGPRWTGQTRFEATALSVPLGWQVPRFVFVNSMSDTFYESFAETEIAAVFGAIILAPLHVYQVLTKREQRAKEFFERVTPTGCIAAARAHGLALSPRQAARFYALLPEAHQLRPLFRPGGAASCALPFPADVQADLFKLRWPMPHLWIGASCNDQESFNRRAPTVRGIIGGVVRFLSLEPLTGGILLGDALRGRRRYAQPRGGAHEHTPLAAAMCPSPACSASSGDLIDWSIEWLIPGGESGSPYSARACEVAWIRSILREAETAGPAGDRVATFVKQLGTIPIDTAEGAELLGAGYRVRPEDGRVELSLLSRKGEDPAEWPEDLLVQEYPRGVYLPAPLDAAA